jgi:hypothetical protein
VILAEYLATQKAKQVLLAAGITAAALASSLAALYATVGAVTLSAVRTMARREFVDALQGTGPAEHLVDAMVELEERLDDIFIRRSSRRVAVTLQKAIDRNEDVVEALDRALRRERRWSRIHAVAARRRVQLRVEEANVRALSPEGAYWLLDPTKQTHTPDCLAMAGKAWSWKVLSVIRPSNRHFQCGCELLTLGEARANALPGADRVRKRVPRAARHD